MLSCLRKKTRGKVAIITKIVKERIFNYEVSINTSLTPSRNFIVRIKETKIRESWFYVSLPINLCSKWEWQNSTWKSLLFPNFEENYTIILLYFSTITVSSIGSFTYRLLERVIKIKSCVLFYYNIFSWFSSFMLIIIISSFYFFNILYMILMLFLQQSGLSD